MTPLKMAAAGVAMSVLLMVFALQRAPAPAAAAEQRFDETWLDTVAVIPPLKKADRLQIASVEPKPVTERMPPAPNAPVSVPPVILVQDEDKPLASRHRRRHAAGNVCTRHNMRKVIIRKSWRCRK